LLIFIYLFRQNNKEKFIKKYAFLLDLPDRFDSTQISGELFRLIAPLYKCAKGRCDIDDEPVAFWRGLFLGNMNTEVITMNEKKKEKRTPIRSATEEDYKKRNFWNVGTFHRASILPETDQSTGKTQKEKETTSTM